jgi:hypothetical protein
MAKKGLGVKLAIWLPTTKSQKLPWFPCVQVACEISLESSQAITLLYTSFQSKVCTQSYWSHKLQESQFWEFRDPHLGVSGQNNIWMLVPWLGTKYTIRGKMVASPKFRFWWVLWIRVCPWLVHAPKCSNYALTNLLFGLCRSMWVSELLVNLPNPISELQHALWAPKCHKPRSAPQLLLLSLFSPLDS